MSFRDMLQTLWPDTSERLTEAVVAQLTDDLEGRFARLLRRRRRIELLRDKLAIHGGDRLRERLARHEDAYERQRLAFDRAKRLRRALLDGVIVAEQVSDAS